MHVTHATNKQKQQSNNKCSWQFVYGLKRPFKVYLGFHAPTQLHVAQHCIALNCTVNCTTHCTTHCTACCTTHHGAYLCHFYEFYWDTRYCIRTLPRGGMYWEIHLRGKAVFLIFSQGSVLWNIRQYFITQYSAMNIYSVKINTSLAMMRESISFSYHEPS